MGGRGEVDPHRMPALRGAVHTRKGLETGEKEREEEDRPSY